MNDIILEDQPKQYRIHIHKNKFNFSYSVEEITTLNSHIEFVKNIEGTQSHYYKYESLEKCVAVAFRELKQIIPELEEEYNMKTVDLQVLAKRYEIHIGKDHFNFAFKIVEVTLLNQNIMVSEVLEVPFPPGGGVYGSVEEAINSALISLKHHSEDANACVDIIVKKKDDDK